MRKHSSIRQTEQIRKNTKGLLTECEVCTGKYLPEVFVQTERRMSEVCAKKTEGKYFPVQIMQTRLIRN